MMYSRRQALALSGIGIAALSGCADAAEFVTGEGVEEEAQPAVVNEDALVETGYEHTEQEEETIDEEVEAGGETRQVRITNHIGMYEREVELSADELADEVLDEDDLDTDDIDEADIDDEDIDEDAIDDEDIPDDVELPQLGQSIAVQTQATTPLQLDGGETAASVFTLLTTPAFEILGQPLNPLGQMDDEELLDFIAEDFGELAVGEQESESTETVLGSETTVSTFSGTTTQGGVEFDIGIDVVSVNNDDDLVVAIGIYPAAAAEEESDHVSTLLNGLEHPAEL